MQNNKWLNNIPLKIGWYLAGFADGEGSFNVSLRNREDHTMGWQIVPSFNVSQKESCILSLFKRHLGCGVIRQRNDGVYYYTITNIISVYEKVIPFFQKFRFLSMKKRENFTIFCKIVKLIEHKQHLNRDGLEKIIQLRENLNQGRGRKRKYSIADWKRFKKENPQRLYAKPRVFHQEKRG